MFDKTEMDLFKKESERMKEEYEEEYRVAQITGEELPEEPHAPVMTMSLEELAVLVETLEEEQELPEGYVNIESLENSIGEKAEDCYFDYPEADTEVHPAGAVLEQYAQESEEDAEAEENAMKAEGSTEKIENAVEKRKETEAKLLMVTQLKRRGFSMEQIHLLKPVMSDLDLEQITTIFEPGMNEEMIKSVIDFIIS